MRRLIPSIVVLLVLSLVVPAGAVGFQFPSLIDILSLFLHRRPKSKAPPDRPLSIGTAVDVHDLKIATTQQRCENWTWAANVETSLAMQDLPVSQRDIVTRTEGGELCKDDGPDFDVMSKVVAGDYPLADGSHARVDVVNVTGAPTVIDDLIVAMRGNRPLLMFWKSHGYLMTGLTYNEFVSADGGRMFEITEIRLNDPMAEPGKQEAVFKREVDNPRDINGIMDVRVNKIEGQSWLHPENEYQRNHQSRAEQGVGVVPGLAPAPPQSWKNPEPAPESGPIKK